jgi:hypothetical protein
MLWKIARDYYIRDSRWINHQQFPLEKNASLTDVENGRRKKQVKPDRKRQGEQDNNLSFW